MGHLARIGNGESNNAVLGIEHRGERSHRADLQRFAECIGRRTARDSALRVDLLHHVAARSSHMQRSVQPYGRHRALHHRTGGSDARQVSATGGNTLIEQPYATSYAVHDGQSLASSQNLGADGVRHRIVDLSKTVVYQPELMPEGVHHGDGHIGLLHIERHTRPVDMTQFCIDLIHSAVDMAHPGPGPIYLPHTSVVHRDLGFHQAGGGDGGKADDEQPRQKAGADDGAPASVGKATQRTGRNVNHGAPPQRAPADSPSNAPVRPCWQ